MKRLFALIIALAAFSAPAWADNNCWNGADYNTTASGGHEDSKVIVGTAGAISTFVPVQMCQASVTNNSGSTVWAMVFDSLTLPSTGAKPKMEWNVATNTTNGEFGYGLRFFTGLVIACSSTEGTLTVTAANACNFHVTIAH